MKTDPSSRAKVPMFKVPAAQKPVAVSTVHGAQSESSVQDRVLAVRAVAGIPLTEGGCGGVGGGWGN